MSDLRVLPVQPTQGGQQVADVPHAVDRNGVIWRAGFVQTFTFPTLDELLGPAIPWMHVMMLNELVAAFVKAAYEQGGNGDLYNEGTSFRIRTMHLPGADMDTVMVVPRYVSRKDMSSLLYPSMVARHAALASTRHTTRMRVFAS